MPRPRGLSATVKTTVNLPGELWRAAKIRAMDDHCDLRTVVVAALASYLGLSQAEGERVGQD